MPNRKSDIRNPQSPPPQWDIGALPRWATPSPRGLLVCALFLSDFLLLLYLIAALVR